MTSFGVDFNLEADERLLGERTFSGPRDRSLWSDHDVSSASLFAAERADLSRRVNIRNHAQKSEDAEFIRDADYLVDRKAAELRDAFRRWQPTGAQWERYQ